MSIQCHYLLGDLAEKINLLYENVYLFISVKGKGL